MAQANDVLKRISALAEEMKLDSLRPQINACHNQLQAGDGINVAVLGRFKAGKSSFLNHLVGRELLPVGVVPVTAVVTRLQYGAVERAEVRFSHGAKQSIPLGDIGLYVAERENPGNRKQVAAVEVEMPALKDLAPMRFVDTPGLGSALAHNTETAVRWLPNAGAALVAVSADAPLSERDEGLLDELRRHTPRIVLLLTKADLLTEAQRAEVLEFVHRELRRKWQAEFPVFFYSVRPGFERLRGELIQELLLPLLERRTEVGDEILRHKLLSVTAQLQDYVRVGQAAASQAQSARQALDQCLRAERGEFELLREEFAVLARQWSATALESSLARLQPVQAELQERATEELKLRYSEWRVPLPALLDLWRAWLRAFLRGQLGEISRAHEGMFCEPLRRAERHLARTLQAFQGRLSGRVQAALGVSLMPHEVSLEVPEPSAPPIDVGYGLDVAFSLAGGLVPVALFRRPVERVLVRKTRWEVEKNLSRLAAGWRDRVAAGINELVGQAQQQAANELTTLEQMLAQSPSSEPQLRRAMEELTALRGQLQSVAPPLSDARPIAAAPRPPRAW